MQVYPIKSVSCNTKIFHNSVSNEKPVPVEQPKNTLSQDVFVKQQNVAFKGRAGGVLGALTGEFIALGLIEMSNATSLFWPLVGFAGCCAGLGFLGSYIQDKIEAKIDAKAQDNNKNNE